MIATVTGPGVFSSSRSATKGGFMKRRLGSSRSWSSVSVVLLLALGACVSVDTAKDDNGGDEAKTVEDTVRRSQQAENAGDADEFLALWTDKGLEAYDVGSREEIQKDEAELGSEKIEILGFSDTKVNGDKATTVARATPEEFQVAKVLYQGTFSLVKEDGEWLIDGFDFEGSPPPDEGSPVVGINAVEYGFTLDTADFGRDAAFRFTNSGTQQHELVLYKGPDTVDIGTAKTALENVDGSELNNIPPGYQVDHVGFAEPGEAVDVTFAEPLPAGTYVIACYIPDGGFNEQFEPVNPDGNPHIQLGMINKFTVT